MHGPAQQRPDDDRDEHQKQLDEEVDQGDLAGSAAQRLEDGGVAEMSLAVALGGQGNGHACQQHREQAAEHQKAFGACQGFVDLLAFIAHIAQPVAPLALLAQPLGEAVQLSLLTGEQIAIADPAALLDHIGSRHVRQIEHQTRAGVLQHASLLSVRLLHDDAAGDKLGFAHVDRVSNVDVQSGEHPRLDPHLTARRSAVDRGSGGKGLLRHHQLPAQGIGIADRLGRDQQIAVVREGHGGEGNDFSGAQAHGPSLFQPLRLCFAAHVEAAVGGQHGG